MVWHDPSERVRAMITDVKKSCNRLKRKRLGYKTRKIPRKTYEIRQCARSVSISGDVLRSRISENPYVEAEGTN